MALFWRGGGNNQPGSTLMTTNRLTRVNELLKRELASAMYRVLNSNEVDLAAITLTRVVCNSNLRKARVFVSVRGDEETQQKALRHVRRHRVDFQQIVADNVVLKYNPQLHFVLDQSVQEGDHVLEILSELGPLTPEDEEIDYDAFDGEEGEEPAS